MISTILISAFILLLMKYSERNTRWWWGFILLTGLLANCGFELSMIQFVIAMFGWKIFMDMASHWPN